MGKSFRFLVLLIVAVLASQTRGAVFSDPSDSPTISQARELFESGIKWFEKGDKNTALAQYTKAIELAKSEGVVYVAALNNRGYVYLGMDRYIEAIDDFTKAIDANPTFYWALRNRSKAWDKLGKLERANADMLEAERIAAREAAKNKQ
jgi:tetratricopeptide (TPR) repeat protein